MDEVKVGECTAVFRTYEIYSITGVIQSDSTRSEMEVSSSPSFLGGEGAMDVKSATTWYQTLIIIDDDAREHAIELSNLVIPCREGHRITVWSLGSGGVWFKAYNHNTRQAATRFDLDAHLHPDFVTYGLTGLMVIFSVIFLMWERTILEHELGALLVIPLWIVILLVARGMGNIIARIRASIIKKTPLVSG